MGKNSYKINQQVALAYVKGEQMKGWFLAQARYLVIFLSGAMLFLGVVLLFGNLHFALTLAFAVQLLGIAPIALVAGLLAIVIEGGTVFTSAVFKESHEKQTRELQALEKVSGKFSSEEVEKRKKAINGKTHLPLTLMLVFVSFSCMGSEIFWQKIMGDQAWYFHIIGAVLGLVCSSLLIMLELKGDTVERLVERSISSSALIQMAMDQSAKAQIYDNVFAEQQRIIGTPEVTEAIGNAVSRRLNGVLAETVSKGGVTVSAEQLARDIKKQREERAAATQFLASGDEALLQIPAAASGAEPIEIKRKPKNLIKVEKAVAKYGLTRMMEDVDKYADELGMDARTVLKHLNGIASLQTA